MLFAGREVRIEKNCHLRPCTDLGFWRRSLRKTSSTVYIYYNRFFNQRLIRIKVGVSHERLLTIILYNFFAKK